MKQSSDLSVNKSKSLSSMQLPLKRRSRKESVNDELSLDQTKLQFLANMNHELRTPLTGLMGAAELMSMTHLSEEQQHYLQIFRNSSEQLLNIVNDVLDFSKMATGQLRLNYNDFDLRSLLHESFLHFEPFAQRKGLSLAYNIHANVPKFIHGDEKRVAQLIAHLISNAIKFTHHGSVELDICQDGESLLIAVRDTGIGIAPNQADRIFDSFYQVDASHSRSYGGTGLGLSICKGLVHLMNGEIHLHSEVRKGSDFQIRLPLVRSFLDLAPAAPQKATCSRFLLVEDSELNQAVVLHLFNKLGHQLDIAADGKQGLELHRKNHYDLIFMDMQMPVMNGFDASRAIRAFDSNVYIVALTGNLAPEVEQECMKIGINDCLAKPLDQTRLNSLLGMFACH